MARLPLLLGAPCPRGAAWAEGDGSRHPWGLLPGPGRGLALYAPAPVQAPASLSTRALGPWDRPAAPRLL